MSADDGPRFSVICLSSQDWDEALPTNRQQIMTRVAARGHDVLFVETRGFLGKHLLRVLLGPGRLSVLRKLVAAEPVAPRIALTKAWNVAPWGQKYERARRINAWLTLRVLRRRAARLRSPVLLWVYDPTAVSRGAERIWPVVYDCVDDYPEQTYGARRRTLMAQSDDAVARAATVVFATTPTLVERQQGRNSSTYHVPNVGDYEHFAGAAEHGSAAPEVAGLPHPVIGFSGNFLAGKVDFALLKALVEARPAWTFLLVGPAQAGTEASLAELAGAQNVVWVGQKPYAELPGYVAAFDVGLIPYLSNAYTQSCFPLKLYEYLAAGKPVVATGLPSLAGLPEVALADASASEVIGAIEDALGRSGDDFRSRRMAIASRNTWESRVGTLLERVGSEVARP